MKTTFVSSYTLSNSSRSVLMQQASNLSKLQTELSTRRKADVGLDLGSGTGEAVTLRSEYNRLNAIMDTNALVASRLDVTQAALDDVLSTAENFLSTLVGVSDTSGSSSVAQGEGKAGLDLLVARLNTQLNGSYIFAGLNTDVSPIADYFGTPAGSNKTAVDTAFNTFFGFNQDDPAVANISAADMETFLDGDFAALFDNPAWGNDWSSASDQSIRSRISTSELAETSVSANEDAFRQLAEAFSMVADLGTSELGEGAYQALTDKASKLLGEAIAGVTDLMADMGTAQERVSNASERLSIQTNILNERINELESVDPTETAVRLQNAVDQMETTYAVTARLSQLSLINYL
ncbi:flagellar hook-associated protein 3 FlgL [Breoghania corrubedonensis]|uniref:Flagellin n=1 Tax=Breoghania corrubedonensis TaxID=665038 RepID=A0A2T5V8V9_9HYPH|nr:flagellar hook-associated family protein [Breoghania corrubedonensis]PTW60164.1 flagellar hook-associated protein 3 FlgL [Breoghania corrubedonensis]